MPKVPVMADTEGRLRVTKAQRREIMAAYGRSGESLPQFARRVLPLLNSRVRDTESKQFVSADGQNQPGRVE